MNLIAGLALVLTYQCKAGLIYVVLYIISSTLSTLIPYITS